MNDLDFDGSAEGWRLQDTHHATHTHSDPCIYQSVTSARASDELLRQKARSRSVGGAAAKESSTRPVKVATQHSVGNSSVRRQRSLRRTEDELIKRSRAQSVNYELSQDLQDKQVEMLERRYGGSVKSRRAAKTIQRAYRQYCMNKNFQKLRNSVAERRLSKLGRSNTVWSDRIATDAQFTMGATVIENGDLTNKHHSDLYGNDSRKRFTDADPHRMKQQMSFDQGYNKFDMQKLRTSRRDRKLERCREIDVTDNGHPMKDGRRKTEENNNRNSCPEMNDSSASDSPQVTPYESAVDIHSLDFETLVESKGSDILTDSFQSDASQDINVTLLGMHKASGTSLASSNISADTLGSNRSINSSYENFRTVSESSDSASITSSQNDMSKDVSPDRTRSREQKHMQEQTVKYLMNSSEVKYRSRKDSGQAQNINDAKRPPVPSRAPEASPIWKRKNGNLNGSTGSVGKLDVKRMSNISETSEPDSENQYSSSPSSENVSAENISIVGDSLSYQRRIRLSVTPDHPHVGPKTADKQRKRVYRIGLNLFNKKPEKGLSFLCEHGFINESPETVARFLITRKGLSKQMIGEYLGNLQNPFNMDVLCYFSEEIDLSGLQVDMALRKFQSYFRMPGEAQKIERLMEVFAERYVDCNPDQVKNFKNQETVLLLAFAIIMLNTDLHNASIKQERKMKLEDFIKNLRGIDDDEDVDRDLLTGIYERVKAQEFRPGVDHVTQVMKVEQTIVGNRKPALALPHRRLVCYCRLYQVHDPNKKEKIGLHQREVFLFNDLLLVTKIFSKKKTGITYSFKQSFSLCDMQVYLFETPHYAFGVRLVNNLDGKVHITFNARNDHDRQKFVEDLKEAILECNGMETLRIDEQQRNNQVHTPLDRHYSNDDTRINMYDYMKTSDPNSNRLSAPDYSGLKQSFPLSNSLTDLCGAQAMRRGSSGGSLDSGVHSGSTGSANSTEISFGSQSSQSSLMKGLALTAPTMATTSKLAMPGPARSKPSSSNLKRPVPEGTEV
ncbi:IQ motif and SEC7 domain-containing protein 1-like isoform X3 [Mercenaria mercenaria]|uniref:IQ motif and SEC7 domain-containing protein 1-like isoform X3 n=1 Tax=Mercenaria mercenaria TaxID=6596 RepID=UPI00234F4596|nr:IQ motif and SEC7 domain-containing protein 1-like isoform X3 [Mercenaria mercenaria]